MTTPRDLLRVLDDPAAPAFVVSDEPGEVLLTLVAHILLADGDLSDDEVRAVERLLGGRKKPPRETLMELAGRPLDYQRLADLFPDPRDRDDVVTLAEHGVWGDDKVEPGEVDILDKLAEVLKVVR